MSGAVKLLSVYGSRTKVPDTSIRRRWEGEKGNSRQFTVTGRRVDDAAPLARFLARLFTLLFPYLRCFHATKVSAEGSLDVDGGLVQDGLKSFYLRALEGPALGEDLSAEPTEHSLRQRPVHVKKDRS